MLNSKFKTGLILEGGAMRGMFSSGVIDVLMENHIRFDGAVGISAGATFGCNYKSHQIGRAIRYNKKYSKDPRYCSIRSLLKTGDLYGADFCYHAIPDELDVFDREVFASDPMEFYVGATDVETGRAVFHLCSDGGPDDIEWMRASASMPVVSKPVTIDDKLYLDGGMSDSVPYQFFEDKGYNRNVIILTQPKGYQKKPASKFYGILLRKYPSIAKAVLMRHEMYNRQMREINEREESGVSIVIRPPVSLGIKRTEKNPDELERVYQIGRKEAERRLEDVKRFLMQ